MRTIDDLYEALKHLDAGQEAVSRLTVAEAAVKDLTETNELCRSEVNYLKGEIEKLLPSTPPAPAEASPAPTVPGAP